MSSLEGRIAGHVNTASTPEVAAVRDETANDIVAQGLAVASTRAMEVRQYLRQVEQEQATQPERLAQARSQAEDERIKALAEEPWAEVMTAIPTVTRDGEPTGMTPMPTTMGMDVFGARLAFDLLGTCADEDQVDSAMADYFDLIRDPKHMLLVCAAALDTIANYVVPDLLGTLESHGDYGTRVRLADAARNAWSGRVADLRVEEANDE